MSIQAITAAFTLQGLSPSEKLLLLALANYADEQGRSYPSQRRLAADTGLTDRTIRKLLADLAARGLLTRSERTRADGSRSSDIISLHLDTQISGGAEMVSGGVRKPLPGGAEMVSGLTTFDPPPIQKGTDVPFSKRARPAKRCPEGWLPTDGDRAVGETKGLTPAEIDGEFAKFRDHTFGTARSDWSATFRNWLRTAAESRHRLKASSNDQPHPPSRRQAVIDRSFAASQGVLERRRRERELDGV